MASAPLMLWKSPCITIWDDSRSQNRGAESKSNSTRGAKQTCASQQRDRRANNEACRIRCEPSEAEAGGRNLRLDEDRRRYEETTASWIASGGLDVYLRGRGIQHGTHAESGAGNCRRERMRRTAPTRAMRAEIAHKARILESEITTHIRVGPTNRAA